MRKTNPIEKYFKYFLNENYSECILCKKKSSGKHGANFERHIKSRHINEYNDLLLIKSQSVKRKREPSPSVASINPEPSTSFSCEINEKKLFGENSKICIIF